MLILESIKVVLQNLMIKKAINIIIDINIIILRIITAILANMVVVTRHLRQLHPHHVGLHPVCPDAKTARSG